MTTEATDLDDLERRIGAGSEFGRAEATTVLEAQNLPRIGLIALNAARVRTGDEVTFVRVVSVAQGESPVPVGAAGEVRIVGQPASIDQALEAVRVAAAGAGQVYFSGFSLADLLALAGHDHLALADVAAALRDAGLCGVAEVPADRLGDVDVAGDVIRAARHGGLAADRVVVERADVSDRLAIIERVHALQREVGGLRAFAPLPRLDPVDMPSTGYDDVKTVAIARLWCRDIARIQVDWPIYGPKLAQVALTFGANDIDGVDAFDAPDLGPRRATATDLRRQIAAAGGRAVERTGRFDVKR